MRHALITAGTKGLGRKVTETMLHKGYSVTVTYRNDVNAAEEMKEEYRNFCEQLHIIKADVTKKSDLVNLVNETKKKFGRIDFLINNAGPYIFTRKRLVEYEDEEWYEMIEGNLSSVFHLVKQVIPIMRNQQFGRIVTYGFQDANSAPGWIYRSAFGAAKVGLASLTKSIALEEGEFGITANMVCPGKIVGEMKEATIEESRKIKDDSTLIGRSGTGEDIARTIMFLCDENSDMITGTLIEVTGGADVINRYRK